MNNIECYIKYVKRAQKLFSAQMNLMKRCTEVNLETEGVSLLHRHIGGTGVV